MLKNLRRKGALERLKNQLKTGKKPEKVDGRFTGRIVHLEKNDTKRIVDEMEVLNKHLLGSK